MGLAFALFRGLIRLLPPGLRREYGAEMEQVVRDHWTERRTELGPIGGFWFWTRQYWALGRARWLWTMAGKRKRRAVGMKGTTDGLMLDLVQTFRALRRRPGFVAITAVTLGVAIGASTAVFSTIDAVLLRDLPFTDPDRILVVVQEDAETGELGDGASAINVADLRSGSRLLEHAAIADPYSFDLIVEGRAESLRAWWAGEGFLESLGAVPHLGRAFASEDYAADGEPVVLLSWSSWVSRFGADSTIVGQALPLDGAVMTVIGVLPAGLDFPGVVELWVPRPPQSYDVYGRSAAYMAGVARLAPGATLEQARAEASAIAASIAEADPQQGTGVAFRLIPIREYLFGDVTTPLMVIAGAVALVLLIACANVAGLFVARGIERGREFAVRDALGAGRGRLVRLMALESVIIAALGSALGLLLATQGVALIRRMGPDHLPRVQDIAIDPRVLTFTLVAGALSAVLAGVLPAVRLSRSGPGEALGSGSRGGTETRSGIRLRRRLVVLEVAGAMVLLVGAGLLMKSFSVLLDEELGFEYENRLAVQTFAYGYEEFDGGVAGFVTQVVTNLKAIPGVEGVALTTSVPAANDGVLAAIDINLPFRLADRPAPPTGQGPQGWVTWVSSDLFEVLGQPLVVGRAFEPTDDVDAPRVAIINETLARRHFGDENPVGYTMFTGTNEVAREIVGVVADVRPRGHASVPRPEIYLPLSQSSNASLSFLIQTSVAAGTVMEPAREAIWAANPNQAIWGAATLESLISDRLIERRFNLTVLGAFAGVALFLSLIGIYGLGSYSVRVRRNELGIRRALGGQSSSIVLLVLSEGTRLGAIGVAIGVAGSLLVTRLIQGMLFGVEATDPGVLAVLTVLVIAASTAAALIPALQAHRVDPAESLRAE